MVPEGSPAEATPPKAKSLEPTRRLFFALWPDEAMREAMARETREVARAGGGRPVPPENLHVTLAFLGSVPERWLPRLVEIARAVAGSSRAGSAGAASSADALELTFDRIECWRPAHLLCALAAEPPAPVAALARTLQDLLAQDGFAPDLKSSGSVGVEVNRRFRPHLTLARKVHRPPRAMGMEPITWSFADFVLVDSKTLPEGSVYTVLERFPLPRSS